MADTLSATSASDWATLVCVQTPRARGAIAVVSVAGPLAISAVDACFLPANGRRLIDQPIDRIRFGRWAREGGEELVICRREPLHGHAHVEVHCHGGEAAVRAIVSDLTEQGCQTADAASDWQSLTLGLSIPTEAAIALPQATTAKTAAILLDQQQGVLDQQIETIRNHLRSGDPSAANERLNELIERIPLGEHLTKPWQVVLAGAPNVGKSSLINAILGYQRAIVFDQPGTTRDVVTASTAIDGWPVELSDTAGLRTSGDAIEAVGMELAVKAVRSADLVLHVEAAGEASSESTGVLPPALAAELSGDGHRLTVINKIDLASPSQNQNRGLPVSATQETGLEDLIRAIGQALVPMPPKPSAAVPFTQRQRIALLQVSDLIRDHATEAAQAQLLALTKPPPPAWPVRPKSDHRV